MLFFLLSGFLMTYLHIDLPFRVPEVKTYLLRRFARVYPLFVLVAAFPLLLQRLHFPADVAMKEVNTFTVYLRQIALLDRGVGVFWTIRVELLFYLVFVAIWLIHRKVENKWITAALLLSAVVALRIHHNTFQVQFFEKVHYFLFGVTSAMALPYGRKYRHWLLAGCGLLLFLSFPLTYPKVSLALFHVELDPWRSDLVAVFLIALFNVTLRDGRWLYRLLASRGARWLGKVSYSVYLLHYFVLLTVLSWVKPEAGHIVRFSLFLVGSLLFAALSNRLLERPIQRFVLGVPQWKFWRGNKLVQLSPVLPVTEPQ
jgi:peptidoglycan/LPS O-acetylase OafA/YrhL